MCGYFLLRVVALIFAVSLEEALREGVEGRRRWCFVRSVANPRNTPTAFSCLFSLAAKRGRPQRGIIN